MVYKPEEIERIFSSILEAIEKGESLRNVLKSPDTPSSRTFYIWLEADEEKVKRYARACKERASSIFEDILSIADDSSKDVVTSEDGRKSLNSEFAARSRIRIDARKWMLSKLEPKVYGDRTDITSDGKELKGTTIITLGSGVNPNQ